jgi:hypothetical protein
MRWPSLDAKANAEKVDVMARATRMYGNMDECREERGETWAAGIEMSLP